MKSVQQIQLITGQEIMANILHWEEDTYIEANNILEMIPMNDLDLEDNKSYYILKPWITYTDSLGKTTTINPASIMCVTDPSPVVMQQYLNSLQEIITSMKEEEALNTDDTKRETQGNVISFTPKTSPTLLTE